MNLKAALLCSAVLLPSQSHSAVFTALYLGFTGATGIAAATAAIAFPTAFAVSSFLGTTVLGGILLNVGVSAAISALTRSSAPKIDAGQANIRLENSARWTAVGRANLGGHAGIFIEYDDDGNLWYIVAHGDMEALGEPSYILDGIEVQLSDGTDGHTAGDVLTDAFCLTPDGTQYEGEGDRSPVWRLYTVTPSPSAIWGAKPTEFTDAFAGVLPDDFYGIGVTYTIIRGRALKNKSRPAAYRWRGALGTGEPAVSLVSDFTRVYDPRDPSQEIGSRSTWKSSNANSALIWAWWRSSEKGRNKGVESIDWDALKVAADKCDATVLNRNGDAVPTYAGGFAFPENKTRWECEQEILATMDAYVSYNDAGQAFLEVGEYSLPEIEFAGRDIFTAQTQGLDDGEAPLDGVVGEYISPDHGWTTQRCAPWINPEYYSGTTAPNYDVISVLGCQDHNQMVRLCKAHGRRTQAVRKGAFGTTIKGILAKQSRGVIMAYDSDFTGPHQIVSNPEEDKGGALVRFAVVPMAADDWTLNDGEEGAPPQIPDPLTIDTTLEVADSVSIGAAVVAGAGGASVRLEATFSAPQRIDRMFRFRYRAAAGGSYEYFVTDMDELRAYSAIVADGVEFIVSWQTFTAGGRATIWSDERDTPESATVTAAANTTPPNDLVSFKATGGAGEADLAFATGNDGNVAKVRIYQGTTSVFASAAIVDTAVVVANASYSSTILTLAADTYYFWALPLNQSNLEGPISGPKTATVT